MCGESSNSLFKKVRPLGSPPHVWGKLVAISGIKLKFRITPTCVGKASCPAIALFISQDHPHMCGESTTDSVLGKLIKGSPPHVWGKLNGG